MANVEAIAQSSKRLEAMSFGMACRAYGLRLIDIASIKMAENLLQKAKQTDKH